MAEYTINLRGWHALVAVVVIIGLIGIRLLTIDDYNDDPALMEALEVQLMAEYYPGFVKQIEAAYETADREKIEHAIASVTNPAFQIGEVKISVPLLDFSTTKDVVVKVRYSMDDASGVGEDHTRYYLYRRSMLGNYWGFGYATSAARYYLNFW